MMFSFGRLNGVLAVALLLFISGATAASPQFYKPRSPAVNAPGLQTNAKRLAAGLSPLKPRNLFQPSKVAARDAAPSPITVTGRIRVNKRASDGSAGTLYGHLAYAVDISGDDAGSLEVDNTVFTTLHGTFSFVYSALSGSTLNVKATLSNSGLYPYLGFAFAGTASPKLTTGQYNLLVATNPTSPGASASATGNSLTKLNGTPNSRANPNSESAIWGYTPSTGRLIASWNNPGGETLPTTKLFYDTIANTVYQGTSDTSGSSTIVEVVFTVVT